MYLNLVQIAGSLGVSEKVVRDWVRREGLPHVTDRGFLLFDRARVASWAALRGLTAQAGFLASEKGTFTTEFTLEAMLRRGGIWRDVPAPLVIEVFERIVASLPGIAPAIHALLARRLRAERGVSWAPAGGGFALPHFSAGVTLGRDAGAVALVLAREGLALPVRPPDAVAVTRLLFFVPPSPRAHLDTLGRLARLLTQGPLRALIERGAGDEEILRAVAAGDSPAARPADPGETT